jgi:beta-galactosidase
VTTARRAEARPDLPLLLCEYTHAMGNSSGGLKEYWDVFYADTNARGAFVWDWVDQGIRQPRPDGNGTFLAYGGWWEDRRAIRNDNNFSQNGLISADRVPHPGLSALKYVYRYIHAEPVDLARGTIRIKNWHDFLNTRDEAVGVWEIVGEDGEVAAHGDLPELDIAPRQEQIVTLPLPSTLPIPRTLAPTISERHRKQDYWLTVRFLLRADRAWARKGHELAWEQWPVEVNTSWQTTIDHITTPLAMADGGNVIRFSNDKVAVVFDRLQGTIGSYSYNGVKLLDRGPIPDFWRPMTDNDLGAWKAVVNAARRDPKLDVTVWRHAGPAWSVKTVQARRIDDGLWEVDVDAELPLAGAKYRVVYSIDGAGGVTVDTAYTPGTAPLAMMPRFGTQLIVSPGFEHITWFGRGPAETYVDRQFERLGTFRSTVREQWVEYSRPQENGNRTDVRWVSLTNDAGVGLMAIGEPTLSVGAMHATHEDLEKAGYTFQLPQRAETYLNLDWKQMGAGGIDSWSRNAWPMEPYRIAPDQPMRYSYRLVPVTR